MSTKSGAEKRVGRFKSANAVRAAEKERSVGIVLCGNPNAGKTTLFNNLVRGNEKAGNWHGVTVKEKAGEMRLGEVRYRVTDLPGLYTVKNSKAEELVAERFLRAKNYDVIVVVIEAKNLPRGARLIEELKVFKKPIIAFINLYGDFKKKGGRIDEEGARRALGVETIFAEADDPRAAEMVALAAERAKLPAAGIKTDYYFAGRKSSRLSDSFFNPLFAGAALALLVFATFYLAFGKYGLGKLLSGAVNYLFERFILSPVSALSERYGTEFSSRFVTEGVLGGIGAVLAFIPQIAVLSFSMDFLDASGIISRLSAAFDGVLGRAGLSGKSLYSLASGFGCTALAAELAVGIEDKGVRRRTVLSLPLVSCSARTPVYMYIADRFTGDYSFAVLAVIYILSAILPIVRSAFLYRTVDREKSRPLVFELADLRFPKIKPLLKSLRKTLKGFIIRLGTVITVMNIALFLLANFSFSGYTGQTGAENSFLALLSKGISFIFVPIGITDWRLSAAIITGIFAKEGIASTLAILLPSGFSLGFAQGVALTAFCYLYTPCFTALAAIRKKLGFIKTAALAVWQFLSALLAAYIVYFIFNLL